MIHDILELGDMSVHEVMRPRVDMILAQDVDTVRQNRGAHARHGYSRLPV